MRVDMLKNGDFDSHALQVNEGTNFFINESSFKENVSVRFIEAGWHYHVSLTALFSIGFSNYY
ncbi:MAG: hypothetical protein ACI8O8_000503 [Oleiphilaceae bacterium]|jgi:hypothetical protein